MTIELTESEIRTALAEAISKKTDHIYTIDDEDCYFNIVIQNEEGEEVDVSDVFADIGFGINVETT